MRTPSVPSNHRSPLTILFICVFVDMIGYGMVVPLLPFLAPEGSARALLVGLLSSLYALLQFLAAPVLGALSDRVGRRPVLIGAVLASSAAYSVLSLGASIGALPLVFLAVALGGAAGASIPTAQACIADRLPPAERARGLGLIGAAFGLGLMLGPASGGLLSVYGLGVPPLLAATLALLNGLFALRALPESLPPERRAPTPLRPAGAARQLGAAFALRDARPLLVAIFLLNMAFAGLQSNAPLFTSTRFGWGPLENGAFFAFIGACAVLTQGVILGRLLSHLAEARLVSGGLGLMALTLGGAALAPAGWMLYPLVGAMALGIGLAAPSITSLVSRLAGEGRQGAVMGGMQAVLSLTLILGPALAGVLFDTFGPGAPYLGGGTLALGALGAALVGLAPAGRAAPAAADECDSGFRILDFGFLAPR